MVTSETVMYTLVCIFFVCLQGNPEAAVGTDCGGNSSVCDSASEICNGSICICNTGYYDNGGVCNLASKAPRSVMLHNKTSDSVTLSWIPETPKQGITTYIIAVFEKAENSEEFISLRNETVLGYDNTTATVHNLSSYWDYKFSVQARVENLPPSEFVRLDGVVTTEESAPAAVVNINSSRTPSGQTILSWSCPAQKDGRNGVIKSTTVFYKANRTDENVRPEQGILVFPVASCSWEEEIYVTPEFNHTFEVYITNTFDGKITSINKYIDAFPPFLWNSTLNLVSESETSAVLDICPDCFYQKNLGTITKSGLLVCRPGNCLTKGDNESRNADYYDSLANWDKAKSVDFKTLYRTTDDDWLKNKQDLANLQFTLGGDNCSIAHQKRFCNGPLPVDHTYRVLLFACTLAGCSQGTEIEFRLSKTVDAAEGLPASTIAAIVVVVVIVVIVVVLVIVYIKFIRPRSTKNYRTS